MTEFADSQVVYRDLGSDAWGSHRLFVGGKDVTTFRDIPAQIGGYQLTEPYGYGPATFKFPQITAFEYADWGTGTLKWFDNGKPVQLIQVDSSGSRVRTVWEGEVTRPSVADDGTTIACDGLASGRLSRQVKQSVGFGHKKLVGRAIFDGFGDVGLRVTPFLGGDIGPKVVDGNVGGWWIDHMDNYLAATVDTDGSRYTVMPTADGKWELAEVDTTTVDFTIHYGAHGVKIDLSDDLTERPTTIFGSGVSPENLVWNNMRFPQAQQGDPPDYPMDDDSAFGQGTTDADTDSGDGVTVMVKKLGGTGWLPRSKRPGGFDADVTRALKDLQEEAGLTESGNMNVATWNALFDVTTDEVNLRNSFLQPLGQTRKTRKYDRTANGTIAGLNPAYDPSIPPIHREIDYGARCEQSRARRNARGIIAKAEDENLAGTVTLSSDVFDGDHTHGDASPTLMSRLDLKAGMNCYLKNVTTALLHVSVVNVSGDFTVTLGVDSRARDAATLAEVIQRNIESRINPARQWKRQHLSRVNFRQVEASVDFGVLWNKVSLKGNQWSVVKILAGDAGNSSRVRIQTTNDEAEFCFALFAQRVGPKWLKSMIGSPFVGTGVSSVVVSDGGSSYESAPSVSFSGGGGSGATATAHIGSTGTVTQIVLTNRGSGYTSAPTVSLSGGGGSGASAHTTITLDDPWSTGKIQKALDRDRSLLGAWGTADQPAGYHPKSHTKADGTISDAPITGLFMEDAGFDYHTFRDPFIYLAIFPDRDCVLKQQRILWAIEESDA